MLIVRKEISEGKSAISTDDIICSQAVVHDMNYINNIKKTSDEVKREEKDYISLE